MFALNRPCLSMPCLPACQSVREQFGLQVVSIVGLSNLLAYLQVSQQTETVHQPLERKWTVLTPFTSNLAVVVMSQEGSSGEDGGAVEAIRKYREQYGVTSN